MRYAFLCVLIYNGCHGRRLLQLLQLLLDLLVVDTVEFVEYLWVAARVFVVTLNHFLYCSRTIRLALERRQFARMSAVVALCEVWFLARRINLNGTSAFSDTEPTRC